MEVVVGGGGGGEKLYSQNLRDFLRIEEDHRRNLNHSTSSSSGGGGGGGGGRRSSSGLTLSAVLGDKIGNPPPVEGGGGGRRSSSGLTLSAVLGDKIGNPPPVEEPLRRVESNRTLLDIIREDQTAGLSLSIGRGREQNRRSWRHLKDKIRLRRRGAAPPATATPQRSFRFILSADSGESSQQNPIPLRNPRRSAESSSGRSEPPISPPRTQLNEIGSGERLIDAAEAAAAGASPEQPVRMSLMALLAENDRQMGYESSAYVTDEGETTGDDVASSSAAAGGGAAVEFENCCVCMVRHKGAAFIPCGHTFCRLCSRELWVQRGNCPLCNNFIVEVLDIF